MKRRVSSKVPSRTSRKTRSDSTLRRRSPSSDDSCSDRSRSDNEQPRPSSDRQEHGEPGHDKSVDPTKGRKRRRSSESASDHDGQSLEKKKIKVLEPIGTDQHQAVEIIVSTPSTTPSTSSTDVKSHRPVVLIFDTNILLEQQGLDFLNYLVKNEFNDVLPNLQVVIPHIVFLELDRHKSNRKKDLAFRARCAGRILDDHMCRTDAAGTSDQSTNRITGQTLAEFTEASKRHTSQIPDDHFLFCCLQYLNICSKRNVTDLSPAVIPVTNDRLLRCRCTVNGLRCQSLGSLLDNIERRRSKSASLFDWTSCVVQKANENDKENKDQ